MGRALRQAWLAGSRGEVPVGAVLMDGADGRIIGQAGNETIGANDPTAHAEILAIRRGATLTGNHRLTGAVLVVTLEPCLMCLGAMVQARIGGLVFAARDPKAGAVVSNLDGLGLSFLNHRFPVLEGVLAEECGRTLSRFFAARRKQRG
jgi:tRNA(adenine34) deaminase